MSFAISVTTVTKVDSFELPLSVFVAWLFGVKRIISPQVQFSAYWLKGPWVAATYKTFREYVGTGRSHPPFCCPHHLTRPVEGRGRGQWSPISFTAATVWLLVMMSSVFRVDLFRPRLSACLLIEVTGWKKLNRAPWRSNSSLFYSPTTNL